MDGHPPTNCQSANKPLNGIDIIVPNCAPIDVKREKNTKKNMISYHYRAFDPPHALSLFTNEKKP